MSLRANSPPRPAPQHAIELARRATRESTEGVFFVDLAPLNGSELVVPALAQALDVIPDAGEPVLETVKRAVGRRRLFIVLDNFEHVLESAREVSALRGACPQLKFLTTSRAPLRISSERLYEVPPLAYPSHALGRSLAKLARYEAIALFARRARAVDPEFRLTETNAQAVAEICARLDGLPLAIELAAARTRILPPKALLGALDHGAIDALAAGPRDAPARQRTLRATVDWSHRLLTPVTQRVFARLAVFRGGFTLEAAPGRLQQRHPSLRCA
jgi:predicted ATPase